MDLLDALVTSIEENGWSAAKVADAVGISEAGVNKWLDRKSRPSGENVLVLIRVLPGFGERLGLTTRSPHCAKCLEDIERAQVALEHLKAAVG